MRIYMPFLILFALLLIACLPLVQGQNSTSSGLATPNSATQSTEYHTMPTVSAPSTHISAPVQINILGKTLTTLYLGLQAVPYSKYQSNGYRSEGISLWIQRTPNWVQYAEVPQGASVTLMAVSPTGGSGYLSETFNGTAYNSNFYFYRNSQLTFYADAVGRHTLSLNINGQLSNQVTINVIALVPLLNYLTPYNNYLTPYSYMTPNYYYSGYQYPSYKFRGGNWPRFYGGHDWYRSDYPWLNAP